MHRKFQKAFKNGFEERKMEIRKEKNMERLTRKEAAEFLGCSMSALYSLEKSGQLEGTYYKIGKRKLYIKSKLEKWALDGGEKKQSLSEMKKYAI